MEGKSLPRDLAHPRTESCQRSRCVSAFLPYRRFAFRQNDQRSKEPLGIGFLSFTPLLDQGVKLDGGLHDTPRQCRVRFQEVLQRHCLAFPRWQVTGKGICRFGDRDAALGAEQDKCFCLSLIHRGGGILNPRMTT